MKYTIEFTEEQMRVTQNALEEYFRLRMGQVFEFGRDLASIGVDLTPSNPDHENLFGRYIQNADWVEEVMKGIFRALYGPYGVPKEKTEDMMIAECIWDAIRFSRGQSRWNEPFHIGSEPVPKIEKGDTNA